MGRLDWISLRIIRSSSSKSTSLLFSLFSLFCIHSPSAFGAFKSEYLISKSQTNSKFEFPNVQNKHWRAEELKSLSFGNSDFGNSDLFGASCFGFGICGLQSLPASRPGYIGTKRFLRQIVPGGLKCSSPAAAAHAPVFTDSTFAFVFFKIAEVLQYL